MQEDLRVQQRGRAEAAAEGHRQGEQEPQAVPPVALQRAGEEEVKNVQQDEQTIVIDIIYINTNSTKSLLMPHARTLCCLLSCTSRRVVCLVILSQGDWVSSITSNVRS